MPKKNKVSSFDNCTHERQIVSFKDGTKYEVCHECKISRKVN